MPFVETVFVFDVFWNLESVSCLKRRWLLNPQSYTWTFHKHPLTPCSHIHNIYTAFSKHSLSALLMKCIHWINNNKHMANQSKINLWNSSLHIANKLPQHYSTIFSYSTWGESMCVFLFPVISQTGLKYRCLGALSLLMNIQNINMNINILKMESYRCTVQLAIVTGTTCLSMPRCV